MIKKLVLYWKGYNMNLLKFRVKNYKSIVDSGDCYFSDKLTILAGKNESGKTSILEALEDFHEEREIRSSAKPIGKGNIIPEVAVTFRLTTKELNEIYTEAELDIVAADGLDLELYKYYGNKDHFLTASSRAALNWQSLHTKAINAIKKLDTTIPKPKYTSQSLANYRTELKTFRATLSSENEDSEKIDKVIDAITLYTEREAMVKKFVDTFVANKLPYFILFSSFEDSFPDEIPIAELSTNEWAQDLENVSDFDIESIASTDKQEQANHQQMVNTEFTDKFEKYWTQDPICLQVQKNETINFWIVEDGILHKPSQRSQGQQWYLSFFIKIVARISENKPNVILIDEPGLFLHARAQKDLLNVLDNHTSDYPVIFSTHSPYLITEDNLENIRLVEKVGRKTTILGKIHAHKTADRETLTPILTAIGLGVNDSITNLDQKENVVVEGPEDVFYLQAFKLLLPTKDKPRTNFVNGGGASKMGTVGAILEGWGANVYYLFDNDQGFTDGSKELKNDWKVLPGLIKKVISDEDSTIADILSRSDFKKYILENEKAKYTSKNSAYIKKSKLEKVLLARQFLQKVKAEKIKIDNSSLGRIKALFKEIEF